MRNFFAVLVFSIALVGGFIRLIAGPPPPLSVKAPAFAGFEPAKIHVEIRVSPISTDNGIGLTLAGQDYYTTHEWEGDGVKDTRLYSFDFRDVPAGEYELTAKIGSRTEVRAVQVRRVNVLERGH